MTVPWLPRWVPRISWPWPPGVIDVIWTVFALANLDLIFMFPGWETIPFHAIWASLTLVYGFRTWKVGPTLWIMTGVMVLTAVGITVDVLVGKEPIAELTEDPLLALMFLAMAWHARRKLAIERSHRKVSEHNTRLLADQRRFLQDAAHQLRTPITIALGHAELLADDLTGKQEGQDIQVIIGELSRLRRIAERLLVIAAAADPEFLHSEIVALDRLTMELIRRWRPTADRHWQLGRLDAVAVRADRERLSLALDALLENAVRHTGTDDVIQLSVIRGWPGMPVRIVVADSGSGIPEDQLHHIFDRFRTGDDNQSRGTGLGLPLVRAVARAHGGDVTVHSEPGAGSEFELTLPEPPSSRPELPAGSAHTGSGGPAWADTRSEAAGHGQGHGQGQQGSARR
jgi:signal transduction histidine kinase